jgi:hypothetical protein
MSGDDTDVFGKVEDTEVLPRADHEPGPGNHRLASHPQSQVAED